MLVKELLDPIRDLAANWDKHILVEAFFQKNVVFNDFLSLKRLLSKKRKRVTQNIS